MRLLRNILCFLGIHSYGRFHFIAAKDRFNEHTLEWETIPGFAIRYCKHCQIPQVAPNESTK